MILVYDFYYFDEYLDKAKSFNYNKMLVVRNILDTCKYEWVWWVNIDSIILNFGIGLDSIIDDGYELIFTKNCNNVITSGSCFFKNTELVKSFIGEGCEYMKESEVDQCDPFVSYLLNFGSQCSEYLSVTKLIDERVCNSYCDDGISGGGSVYKEGDFLIQFGYQSVGCKAVHFFKYLLPKKVSVVLLASNKDTIESQKIVFDDRHQMLLDKPLIRQKIGIEYDTSFLWAETAVIMSNDRYLAFGESCGSGRSAHGFRKILHDDAETAPWYGLNMDISYMNDSVVLPPFVKHSYDRYGQELT